MSKINVDTWEPESGTAATLMATGDTVTVPSGAELDIASGATLDVNGTLDVTGATVTGLTTGKILQVLESVKTDTASTTAVGASPVDITGMTVDITPSATTSKVLVFCNVSIGGPANNSTYITLARVVGGVEVIPLIGDTAGSRTSAAASTTSAHASGPAVSALQYLDSPATTSAVTYNVKWAQQYAGTSYLNRSSTDTDSSAYERTTSSITVMEIGA
jgi:hypothetical protein